MVWSYDYSKGDADRIYAIIGTIVAMPSKSQCELDTISRNLPIDWVPGIHLQFGFKTCTTFTCFIESVNILCPIVRNDDGLVHSVSIILFILIQQHYPIVVWPALHPL